MTKTSGKTSGGAVAGSAKVQGKPDQDTVRRSLFELLDAWNQARSVNEARNHQVAFEAALKQAEEIGALGDNGKVDTWAAVMARYYRLVDKWDRDVELACFGGPSQGEVCGPCPASRACLYEYRKAGGR